MISLNNKDLILFIIIALIEYLSIYMFFDSYVLFPKIILIILLIFIIKRFNNYLILINCIYIVSLIMVFYKSNENRNSSYNNNENDTIENFTSTLQEFKNKEKFRSVSSNLNSPNLKRKKKKKKEEFREDDYISFDEYKDDFKSYKFTRKTKSSFDALNKMEFYIEKFKELW
jgi:hypothetical protein